MIDAHVHVNWNGVTYDDVIKHMDKLGIDKAWVLAWEAIDGGTYADFVRLSTDTVWRAYEKYPDRFIPFCGVDPRVENAVQKVRDLAKKGFRGYGEHKVRMCIDNPYSKDIYKVCGELGLPVVIHIDVPLTGKEWYNPDIDGLERVAKEFPETVFIGHGPGFWREISGNANKTTEVYPKGKITKGGKLLRVLRKYPNVYADLSAGSGLNALQRDPRFTLKFIQEFHKKLLYGTDCFTSEHLDFLRSLQLDENILEDILHNNAANLIRP